MKDLTSSVFTFEDFTQGNFLYVDKTEYIWNLIRPKKAGYFLSRPRRFGGYHFSNADIHVCNPVSIMNFFQDSSTFYNVSHKKRHMKLPHQFFNYVSKQISII